MNFVIDGSIFGFKKLKLRINIKNFKDIWTKNKQSLDLKIFDYRKKRDKKNFV